MFAKVDGSKYAGNTSSNVYDLQGSRLIDSSLGDQGRFKLSGRLVVFAHFAILYKDDGLLAQSMLAIRIYTQIERQCTFQNTIGTWSDRFEHSALFAMS